MIRYATPARSRLALALIGSFKLAWLLASIFLGSH
jgi:hypothetical protein